MKRPEHAEDCPGCATGWTAGGMFLCSRCLTRVGIHQPTLLPELIESRKTFRAEREREMRARVVDAAREINLTLYNRKRQRQQPK